MGATPQFIRSQEDVEKYRKIQQAQQAGHKYFEVRRLKMDGSVFRIQGLIGLRVYTDSVDPVTKDTKYSFEETGMQTAFEYDEIRSGLFSFVLDDKGQHNRQFFASHWNSGEFDILDADIKQDVQRRAERIKKRREAEVRKEVEESDRDASKETAAETKSGKNYPCPTCGRRVDSKHNYCAKCRKYVTPNGEDNDHKGDSNAGKVSGGKVEPDGTAGDTPDPESSSESAVSV